MTIHITESGMKFGGFEANDLFEIEKKLLNQRRWKGVKKVEFVVKKEQSVIFLEARTSIPKDNQAFFNEVKEKFLNSLTIWFSTVAGRHESLRQEVGENLKDSALLQGEIKLFLVIPKIPKEYIPQASEALRQYLEIERKTWGLKTSDIAVLNKSYAIRKGLSEMPE